MKYEAINFGQKFGLFDEHWTPKIVAEMNNYQFMVEKLKGDFAWHTHEDTDEVFIVIDGDLTIHFRDGAVSLTTGEMYVVPEGVEHKPSADSEVKILLIEPRGTKVTGEGSARNVENYDWI